MNIWFQSFVNLYLHLRITITAVLTAVYPQLDRVMNVLGDCVKFTHGPTKVLRQWHTRKVLANILASFFHKNFQQHWPHTHMDNFGASFFTSTHSIPRMTFPTIFMFVKPGFWRSSIMGCTLLPFMWFVEEAHVANTNRAAYGLGTCSAEEKRTGCIYANLVKELKDIPGFRKFSGWSMIYSSSCWNWSSPLIIAQGD